jgi:hypothetical protein
MPGSAAQLVNAGTSSLRKVVLSSSAQEQKPVEALWRRYGAASASSWWRFSCA